MRHNPEKELDYKKLKEIDYLQEVFLEAMRLYPTAWMVSRYCPEPLQYKQYSFPAGTPYFSPQVVMHRHKEHWKEPNTFRPEHFSKEETKNRHKFAYFPFGAGPRNCIGTHFAMLEAKVILANLIKRFKFDAENKPTFKLKARITMCPEPGVTLNASPR